MRSPIRKKRPAALLAAAGLVAAGIAVPLTTTAAQAEPKARPAAADSTATDQFIVSFDDSAVLAKVNLPGVLEKRELSTGELVVKAPSKLGGKAAERMMKRLLAQPGVTAVEPDVILTAQQIEPNDPRYAEQWDLFEETAGMNVPGAWDVADGSGVTVAVLDTGITPHSDLDANVVPGYDFINDPFVGADGDGRDSDPNDPGDFHEPGECGDDSSSSSSWHGTHVAGTIAAVTSNTNGIAGVAPGAKIQPVRVLGKCGGYLSDIADAMVWASGGKVKKTPKNPTPADVINMSLGGGGACSKAFQRSVNKAVRNGTTIVVAAGNSNSDTANFQPASCANVINVAASDREGNRSWYSNYGEKIDLAAPGGEVRDETDQPGERTKPEDGVLSTLNAGETTQAGETYDTYMGTSMAAPHVAGLAALVLSAGDRSPAEVETLLKGTARPLAGVCDGGCGAGLADATAAVNGG